MATMRIRNSSTMHAARNLRSSRSDGETLAALAKAIYETPSAIVNG